MENFGLYIIITKPMLPHVAIAEKCVEHGIRMVQLREKHLSDRELLKVATDIRAITRGTQTAFVVNDRPDIAALSNADFLHLGQDDISVEEARSIVGDMRIGLSTHSIVQAQEAMQKDVDYIGFGPVFPTNAKAIPDAPVGTNQLKQVLKFATVPVVAIGGIFPENLPGVLDAGAKNYALVRYFMQTLDFDRNIQELKQLLKNT